MKKIVFALVVLSPFAHGNTVSDTCLLKAGQQALVASLQPEIAEGFRSVRLGAFADQGKDAQKQSPYVVENGAITVTVSKALAMSPDASEDQEVHTSEIFELKILDAANCVLGPAENVTGE